MRKYVTATAAVAGLLAGLAAMREIDLRALAADNRRVEEAMRVNVQIWDACSDALDDNRAKEHEIDNLKQTLTVLSDDYNRVLEERRATKECGK